MKGAIAAQPTWPVLDVAATPVLGAAFMAVGSILVASSMFRLGITGTYLGDYCGILMDARVTGFPFNVLSNPMYDGSTLNFLGMALW